MASIPSVVALLHNMRRRSPQQIDPRPGITQISRYASGLYGTNVHSLKRMNSGASFIRLAGINTNLVELVSNSLIDSHFSGNPLSMIAFRPEQSPLPWMYVADSNQMRKISMGLLDYLMGVATPLVPPTTAPSNASSFGPESFQIIYDFSKLPTTIPTDWVAGGTAGGMVQSSQYGETITAAIPDVGTSFPQFASIFTTDLTNLTDDAILTIAGFPSIQIPVFSLIPAAFVSTTITSIVYASGSTGLCTITIPSGLLPNNSIVYLSGTEYVQAFGGVINPDGTATFQCITNVTHANGDSVVPKPTIRSYITFPTLASSLVGNSVTAYVMATSGHTVTVGTGTWTLTAQKNLLTTTVNGVRGIVTTGSSPDSVYIAFFTSTGSSVTSVEIQFDVDATTNNFSGNYYSFTASGPFSTGWNLIQVPLTSFTRTGSDTTRSLANVAATMLSVTTTGTIGVAFGSFWIGGPFGPYQGALGLPYQYQVVARSTATGALSNGSPATRTGLTTTGNGQGIAVYMTNDPDPQVNVYDVYRFGGSLPQWIFIGTMPNPAPGLTSVLFDVFPDSAIAANPQLQTDNFQPFPTVDIPRSGVVNVNGTTVTWVSGDKFNVNWSQGTLITINGVVYTFYQQPSSNTSVQLNQVAGQQTNVSYQINEATILGVPLPFLWGPFAQGTASFLFACGDTNQPGVLFLTKGNNPDSGPDTLQIEITSPSEPLINGCMYDGTSFVFSSDRLFRMYPLFGSTIIVTNGSIAPAQGTNLFTPIEVPNGRGLYAPWGLAVGPKIWFIARDGIYETTGGEPVSITARDWGQLFPHEGEAGQVVTAGAFDLFPPDFTKPKQLRLSYMDSYLYFDYPDTTGQMHTLVYDTVNDVWSDDIYVPQVSLHYGEEGTEINSVLLGGNDGNVWTFGGLLDGPNPFPCSLAAPVLSEGTSRYQTTRSGYVGLIAPNNVNVTLGMQMDQGPPQTVTIPVTITYANNFSNMPAMKGRLQQWYLSCTSPFTAFMRDSEFGLRPWGAQGPFRPVNPFAAFNRAQAPRGG